MDNSKLLENLNEAQKRAVTFGKGPILVVAGAGTGKTTVITRRIAWLIEQKLAKPEEILALTFTDKAAMEMEERVDELVPYGFVDTWVSTFHAFGDRVLRDHAIDLDLPLDFRVLSDSEQLAFFREHIFEFPLNHLRPSNNPYRYTKAMLKFFSRLKDEDIDIEQFKSFTQKALKEAKDNASRLQAEKDLELATCFEDYNNLLHQKGFVDFGDQISLVLCLFRKRPEILQKYREQFKYILVDEFQDTNRAQNEILKILAPDNANLMVVGDDDQSIYRFRGAALSNILEFMKNWPAAKQIVLTRNYRSGASILKKSYELINQNNPNRLEVTNKISKELSPAGENKNYRDKVNFILANTLSAEADFVAQKIKEEIKKGVSPENIVILVRKNSDAEPFERALTVKNIPCRVVGSSGLYNLPEIINLISFVKVVANPLENMAHFHLITSEIYGLNVREAVYLNGLMHNHPGSLEDVYHEALELKGKVNLSQEGFSILSRYLLDIENYRNRSLELTAGQLIYLFLNESGYLKRLLLGANKDPNDEAKVQNIAQFFEQVRGFDIVSEDKSIHRFYFYLDDLLKSGDNPATAEIDPDLSAVNIITVHKAKGLEFDVVFLVNLVNGNFPAVRRSEEFEIPRPLLVDSLDEIDVHLEEERRLFYVALTRAKKKLYLTASEDHGSKIRYKISQFVIETIGSDLKQQAKHKLDAIEKIETFARNGEIDKLLSRFYEEGKTLLLTPHQIDDYLSCPLKFKYVHVFRIPLLKNHAVIYGSAIHSAVQYYFEMKKRNKEIAASDLIRVFQNSWSQEGFYTRKHEEERFRAGKKALTNFFKKAEKEKFLPQKIEEPFSFVLNDKGHRTKVSGRYDAVYIREKMVEIRDFKTANIKIQAEADKRAKENNQLAIYALSWRENFGSIPDKLSLYFVDSELLGTTIKDEKSLNRVAENIQKVAQGIRVADFAARPLYKECERCAYAVICPHKKW